MTRSRPITFLVSAAVLLLTALAAGAVEDHDHARSDRDRSGCE